MNLSSTIRSRILAAALVSVIWSLVQTSAQGEEKSAPAAVNATLPKVLIIGDSISIGYTDGVRQRLEKEAEVQRIPGNGQSTDFGLQHIEEWLGDEKWEVIHFNWGIWDTHIIAGGAIRNTTEVYRANLKALIEKLKVTGARLVWASTTPPATDIGGELGLKKENTAIYNAIAKSVVDDYHVPIDDLYSLVLPRLKTLQAEDGVHFTPAGSEVLAEQVAESIRRALKAPAEDKSPAAVKE